MILYKYMSLGAAKAVLENQSIGFSNLEDFNDPFEGRALVFDGSQVPPRVQLDAYLSRLRAYGVLSLTRTPLNALMWAHYGDEHRGVVLGIDTDIAGFNIRESCLIPADYGDIIYTATHPGRRQKSGDAQHLLSIGDDLGLDFEPEKLNFYRDAFLYKSANWAYEEEVRVVKNVRNIKGRGSRYKEQTFSNAVGDWEQKVIGGRPLYCYRLPEGSIQQIYFGEKTFKNVSRAGVADQDYQALRASWIGSVPEAFQVVVEGASWSLGCKKI